MHQHEPFVVGCRRRRRWYAVMRQRSGQEAQKTVPHPPQVSRRSRRAALRFCKLADGSLNLSAAGPRESSALLFCDEGRALFTVQRRTGSAGFITSFCARRLAIFLLMRLAAAAHAETATSRCRPTLPHQPAPANWASFARVEPSQQRATLSAAAAQLR